MVPCSTSSRVKRSDCHREKEARTSEGSIPYYITLGRITVLSANPRRSAVIYVYWNIYH